MKGSSLFIINSLLLTGLVSGAMVLQNVRDAENQKTPVSDTAVQQASLPTAPAQTAPAPTPPQQTVENPATQPAPTVKPATRRAYGEGEGYDD